MSIKSFLHQLNRKDIRLLPRVPKYLTFFLFALFLIAAIFFIPKTKALDVPKDSDIIKIQKDMDLKNNQQSWMKSGLSANLVSANILIGGTIPEVIDEAELESYRPGGAIGQIVNMTGSLYYMPVSGIQYVASIKDNLFGKPAYAQTGVGFAGLQPLMQLWSAVRNMVYVLISFFFIILGIMIMLRVKISPQAVMNIQNTIPKIITILILVTFSYAIAGFMIDLTYLIYNMFLWLMFTARDKDITHDRLYNISLARTIKEMLKNLFTFGRATEAHTYKALNNPGFWDTMYLFSSLVPTEAINLFGTIITFLLPPGIGTIGILLILVINIIIFCMMAKFFFGLAKVYVNILFKVILGPIEIAMGAFPGSKMNFSSWAMSLFANLMVFPVSLGFIIFIHIFQDIAKGSAWVGYELWHPPGLGGYGNSTLNLIIGFVGMTILPAFPTLIPQMITQAKPSPFGQALNQQMASLPIVSTAWKTTQSGLGFYAQNQIKDGITTGVQPNVTLFAKNKILNPIRNFYKAYRP